METVTGRVADDVEVGIVELRAHLGRHLDLVYHRDHVLRIKRGTRPVAVLISPERYESLVAGHPHCGSPDRVSERDVFLTCSGDVFAG